MNELKVYKMYRIFDTLHYRLEDAEALEDGKDVAVLRFVVADEAPLEGEYIEPGYSLFKTEAEAVEYLKNEEAYS